jgi:hypothetical protein
VKRITWSIALSLVALVFSGAAHADPDWSGEAVDDSMKINAVNAAQAVAEANVQAPEVRLNEYASEVICDVVNGTYTTPLNGPCATNAGAVEVPDCEGLPPVLPLWRRTRPTPAEPWSPWENVLLWTCPQQAMPELTVTDFRRLPLAPSVLNIQPARPQVLVNMPTIVYTEPTTQTFTTTLLGFPVEVEATPTSFTWDFGDDTDPITTTSPGHPYPDHDIAQPYTHPGTYTITLTTTYAGRYRMAGTTGWLAVAGTATTTTLSGPIEAIEAPTHLVADDCITNPHGPYC